MPARSRSTSCCTATPVWPAPGAAAAQPDDELVARGSGGGYAPTRRPTDLLLGDESALPAITAALAALPQDAVARVVLEVEDAAHEPGLETPAGARVRFVHRGETTLTEAVQALEWLPGPVHAFVHGEAAEVMRSLRPWLLGDWTTSAYDN